MSSIMAEKGQVQAHYARTSQSNPTSPTSPASPTSPPTAAGGSTGVIAVAPPHDVGPATADASAAYPPLPPYSGPSSPSDAPPTSPQRTQSSPRGPQTYPGLPRLDYRLYSPPLFELSADRTTAKSTSPYLSTTAAALASLVRAQSTVPPKPQIHITGNRGRKVDFAIRLNLMPLLVPDDPHLRMDYLRCVSTGELALRGGTSGKPSTVPDVGGGGSTDGALEAWCRRFVEDPAAVKVFVLERRVTNLDTGWLEGQIRSLVAATGYRGVVTVAFPVTHARVVVQSPDRVNRFFTSVTSFFAGKSTYEVARAVWPFASHPNGTPGRRCAVQSEETWWREWRDPIRYAIATRRSGWVTNEDKLEAIMEGVGRGVAAVDWGPDE